MKYILSFFAYLKRPHTPRRAIPEKNLLPFFWLFIICLLIAILLDSVATNCKYLQTILQSDRGKGVDDLIYKDGFVFSFFILVILTPIIEESIFRYYLTSFRTNYVFLPINLSIIAVTLFSTAKTLQLFIVISTCASSLLFYNLTKKNSKYKITLLKFYAKQYWVFYYCSALTFGVLHIVNYKIGFFIPVLPMLIVMPQIFGGLLLGYVRITKGLKWSMLFHAANNMVALIVLFVSK